MGEAITDAPKAEVEAPGPALTDIEKARGFEFTEDEKNVRSLHMGFLNERVIWSDRFGEDFLVFLNNKHVALGICVSHPEHPFTHRERAVYLACYLLAAWALAVLLAQYFAIGAGELTGSAEYYYLALVGQSVVLVGYGMTMEFMAMCPCVEEGGCCEACLSAYPSCFAYFKAAVEYLGKAGLLVCLLVSTALFLLGVYVLLGGAGGGETASTGYAEHVAVVLGVSLEGFFLSLLLSWAMAVGSVFALYCYNVRAQRALFARAPEDIPSDELGVGPYPYGGAFPTPAFLEAQGLQARKAKRAPRWHPVERAERALCCCECGVLCCIGEDPAASDAPAPAPAGAGAADESTPLVSEAPAPESN